MATLAYIYRVERGSRIVIRGVVVIDLMNAKEMYLVGGGEVEWRFTTEREAERR